MKERKFSEFLSINYQAINLKKAITISDYNQFFALKKKKNFNESKNIKEPRYFTSLCEQGDILIGPDLLNILLKSENGVNQCLNRQLIRRGVRRRHLLREHSSSVFKRIAHVEHKRPFFQQLKQLFVLSLSLSLCLSTHCWLLAERYIGV